MNGKVEVDSVNRNRNVLFQHGFKDGIFHKQTKLNEIANDEGGNLSGLPQSFDEVDFDMQSDHAVGEVPVGGDLPHSRRQVVIPDMVFDLLLHKHPNNKI